MRPLDWVRQAVGVAHDSAVHSRRVRVLAELFAELIPHGHSVLDVGCGDGLIDALILQHRPDLRISGVDVLVRPASRVPVTQFDGEHLPHEDRSCDTVLLCDVLHHTTDPVVLLREASRVGRNRVIIKDHLVKGFLARPTLRVMDFVGNAPHGVALPYNYLTATDWENAYRRSRLVPKEVRANLGLYPVVPNVVFGRSLHFVSSCDILRDGER